MNDWDRIKRLGGQGILSRRDIKDMEVQRNRVLFLMLDGLWHQANEIISYSRGREGLRRMRELREIPGATIERRPHPHRKREFLYRLSFEQGTQSELF